MAMKILLNKKRLFKQGMVEKKILETLRDNDPEDKKNCVRIIGSVIFRNHLILIFELLSVNLYDFLKLNSFKGLSLSLVRRFAIQLLVALHHMRENQIVHCDLKPENILLCHPNKSGIKVIDFGSGTFERDQYYTYIQSRYYRAPEVMLGIRYNPGIDMWSLGCILFELFSGIPLFQGEDEVEQLQCIMEVKGVPPRSLIMQATRRKMFFTENYEPLIKANSRGRLRQPASKDLRKLI